MSGATATPTRPSERLPKAVLKFPPTEEGQEKVIRKLPIDQVKIDRTYQRDTKKGRVERIAEQWNDDLAGVIVVSHRGGDDYYCVDGQHRLAAALLAGKKEIMAEVYEGIDHAEEARRFDLLNKNRSHVNALERFRARLIYGDPEAIEIKQIVEEMGGEIAEKTGRKNQSDKGIRAISSLERVYIQGGPSGLREVLTIIKDAWGELDWLTANEYTIAGLRQFLSRQKAFDRPHLIDRLSSEGHSQIRRMANAHGQIFGGSGPLNFYRAVVEAYNKHLVARNRLRP